jgi:hypothetical protein
MIFHHEPVGAQITRKLRKNWFWALNNPSSTWAKVPQNTRSSPRNRQTTVRRNDEKKSISRVKNPSALDVSRFFPLAVDGVLPCGPFTRPGGDSNTVVVVLFSLTIQINLSTITHASLLVLHTLHKFRKRIFLLLNQRCRAHQFVKPGLLSFWNDCPNQPRLCAGFHICA